MGILATNAITPAAGATGTLTPGAGVTARTSVQVTNATAWTLYLNDSGTPPPPGGTGAKFVLPPRCTATYPLGTPALSYRWAGAIAVTGDLLTFVFSDDPVTAQVWPGVAPDGALAQPVQRITYGNSYPAIGTNQTISTTSGLNIGEVHIVNSSPNEFILFTTGPTRYYSVRPYSWATIPANVPSGSLTFTAAPSALGWRADDYVTVAWSDVNYTAIFPAGAGQLQSPYDLSQLGKQLGGERAGVADGTANGSQILLTLVPGDAFLVTTLSVTINDAPVAYSQAEVQLSTGFDGNGALTRVLRASVKNGGTAGTWSSDRVSIATPILLVNTNAVTNLVMQLAQVGTANQMASVTWGGRYIS